MSFFIFFEKQQRITCTEKKRERVCAIWSLQIGRERKSSSLIPSISSITSTRIIKKDVLDYFLYQGFEDNLSAHTPFIQKSKNKQKNCSLELIKAVRFEECRICVTKGNSKPLSLKLVEFMYVMW